MSLYSANYIQGSKGNSLTQGVDLVVKIGGNPNYIIGQLYHHSKGRKKLIQIEQTGTIQNPQKDQVTFEMKQRKKGSYSHMSKGKYRVVVYAYLFDLGGKRWTDDFEVI